MTAHGAAIVAIAVDDPKTNAALAERLGVRYPILSDPDLATIRAWGVEDVGHDIALPATIIVDRQQKVAWAYVGDAPRDRPLARDIVSVLAGL